MKTTSLEKILLAAALTFLWLSSRAQGTFQYDQQSSIEGLPGETSFVIQTSQPLGQSFTPSLSTVGFVRLRLADGSFDGLGATVHVNLLENSITGNILAASGSFSMPDGFGIGFNRYVDFFFASPISVTPGVSYFFQPVVDSGGPWSVGAHNGFGYSGGTAFVQGQPAGSDDLWFREGIVVPEPGTWALLLLGLGALAWRRCISK
jgi:hypothetical protein